MSIFQFVHRENVFWFRLRKGTLKVFNDFLKFKPKQWACVGHQQAQIQPQPLPALRHLTMASFFRLSEKSFCNWAPEMVRKKKDYVCYFFSCAAGSPNYTVHISLATRIWVTHNPSSARPRGSGHEQNMGCWRKPSVGCTDLDELLFMSVLRCIQGLNCLLSVPKLLVKWPNRVKNGLFLISVLWTTDLQWFTIMLNQNRCGSLWFFCLIHRGVMMSLLPTEIKSEGSV